MKNLLLIAVVILPFVTLGSAQIPDTFSNLQVLPKDISKGALMGNMKSFALGLGLRCHSCHVGEGDDFSTFDFAADDKPLKQKARVMIQMRNAINKQYLTQLGEDNALQVNCVTCHHGQQEPKSIEQVMTETIEKEGIEAATQRYRELREKHYGGFTYDFQELPLLSASESLARSGNMDAALTLLKLNLEFHPESFMTHYSLGNALAMKGDRKAAIQSLEKAYEIMPNPRIKKKIEELSKED